MIEYLAWGALCFFAGIGVAATTVALLTIRSIVKWFAA